MRTILYVVSTLARTGPTTQLFNIVRHLDRRSFAPQVLTLSPEPADTLAGRFAEAGVPVHSLGLTRLRGMVEARRGVAAMVEQLAPAVLHTQGFRADRIVAALRLGTPHVATVRNVPSKDYVSTYGPVGWAMAALHLSAIRGVEVVAVSEAVAAALSGGLGRRPQVIHNGVDTEGFRPRPEEERLRLRQSLGLPPGAMAAISCGHLNRRKDPLFLIDLWRTQFAARPESVLVLAGDGPLRSEAEARAGGAGNIRFLGRVSNTAEVLAAGDVFVSASRAEGFPNAVLEALAAGLPVLLSDIGPHREIAEAVPGAGRLYGPGSPEGFATALAELGGHDGPAMRQAARDIAVARFSATAMSHGYQALYGRLLAAGLSPGGAADRGSGPRRP